MNGIFLSGYIEVCITDKETRGGQRGEESLRVVGKDQRGKVEVSNLTVGFVAPFDKQSSYLQG